MTNILSFAVGDLVVRNGKVLKIFKISQETISLQPFFHCRSNNGLTFTLKRDLVNDGHIRRLVSKTKLKKLLNLIIKKTISLDRCPDYNAASALISNKLTDTLWIIKTLWLQRQENSNTLPGGKLSIYQKALIQTTEEIAAINQTSPEHAKLLLMSDLKSSLAAN